MASGADSRGGFSCAHARARRRSSLALGSCSQSSFSGKTFAVRINQTPGSRSSTSTWRPANSLPSEIWPFWPTTFTLALMSIAVSRFLAVALKTFSKRKFPIARTHYSTNRLKDQRLRLRGFALAANTSHPKAPEQGRFRVTRVRSRVERVLDWASLRMQKGHRPDGSAWFASGLLSGYITGYMPEVRHE